MSKRTLLSVPRYWGLRHDPNDVSAEKHITSGLKILVEKFEQDIADGCPPQQAMDSLVSFMYWRRDSVMAEFKQIGGVSEVAKKILYNYLEAYAKRNAYRVELW